MSDDDRLHVRPLGEAEVERVGAVLDLARLDEPDGVYLVAWSRDEPLGHVRLGLREPHELQDLAVREAHRRRGVARALVAAAEHEAVERGADRLRVMVSVDNATAQALYADRGFADTGAPPRRVRGTITIRTGRVAVDDTLLAWEKRLVDDPAELDAELDRVLVGGRERRSIVIAEPDPGWPQRFAEERERIRAALGDVARRIEHVGSTSVPGLAAKPIVDVLVTVDDVEDEAATVAPLERAGYELRVREPGHRMLRTPDVSVHVHVLAVADPEAERMTAFRDRLRADAADRAAYEQLKRRLARRDWADVNHYARAKGSLVEAILARAAVRLR